MKKLLTKLKHRKRVNAAAQEAGSNHPPAPPGLPHPPAFAQRVDSLDNGRSLDDPVPVVRVDPGPNRPRPRRQVRSSPSIEEIRDVDAPPISHGGTLAADLEPEVQVKRDPDLPFRSPLKSPVRNSRLPVKKKTQEAYVELSSSSEEDLVNLPLSRGDSAYKGPSLRSRVDSVQANRDMSPPLTRRAARRMQSAQAAVSSSNRNANAPASAGDHNAFVPPAMQSSSTSATVPAADPAAPSVSRSNVHRAAKRLHESLSGTDSDTAHPKQKMQKNVDTAGSPPEDRMSEDETSSPVLKPAFDINCKRSRNLFIDTEASHSSDTSSAEERMSVDKYDTDDSFIDDTPLQTRTDRENCRRGFPRTSPPMDHVYDGDYRMSDGVRDVSPSYEEEEDRVHPAPRRSGKRTWTSKLKGLVRGGKSLLQTPPQTPTIPRQSSNRSSFDTPKRHGLDKGKEKAKRGTLEHNNSSSVEAPKARGRDKGKGKAKRRASDDDESSAVVFGDPDEITYESLSEGEREMIMEAIRQSRALKAAAMRRVGEPSTSPSAFTPGRSNSTTRNAPTTPSPITPNVAGRSMADFVAQATPNGPMTPAQSTRNAPSASGSPSSGLRRCPPIPTVCEVTRPELQDPFLADTYHHLVALLAGELIPWSEIPGDGQAAFGSWGEQCPHMNAEMAYSAVTFQEDANFVNPSRASPEDIEVVEQPGTSSRYHLFRNGHPIIAVSSIFLEHSHLLEPTTSGVIHKYIRGIFHSQEWERFVAFVCMALGHKRLHAQLARDALQFSTRPMFEKEDTKKKRKSMFTNTRSPSTRDTGSPNRVNADALSLPTDGPVPVYDARSTNFDFHTDLPNVANLPAWSGEIPFGSFVVVGYTIALYRTRAGKWNLGCNIQWAVVVGVPDDDN